LVRDIIPDGEQFVSFAGTGWSCTTGLFPSGEVVAVPNPPGAVTNQQIVDCNSTGFVVGGQPGILKAGGSTTPFGTLPVLTIVVSTANECPKSFINVAIVDPLNQRAEQNENNNTATFTNGSICATTPPGTGTTLSLTKTASSSSVFVPSVI